MLKKRLFKLLVCSLLATGVVLVLKVLATTSNGNGFVRVLPSHKISGYNSFDIRDNSLYLAGFHKDYAYFGSNEQPGSVLMVNTALDKSRKVNLSGFDTVKVHKGTNLVIDSPFVYLFDGIKPAIIRGDLNSLQLNRIVKTVYFTEATTLDENSFVLRSVYKENGNTLIKTRIGSDALNRSNLLVKQVDGIFCTDGGMVKVPGSTKMIYVYYYRNQFLCVDRDLNLLYKGKTIDTISRAQIEVAKIKSSGEITMAAPPLYVNKHACANEKYLFIQSALRANNETDYMIKHVSMIDVYAVADGKYEFSFYLPDFRGFKVRDFKVYGQSLYALYDHYLYKYQLNF